MSNLYGLPPYAGIETSLGGYLRTLREKILGMKQTEVAAEIFRNRSAIDRFEKNNYRKPEYVRGYTAFIAFRSAEIAQENVGEIDFQAFLQEINAALSDFYRDEIDLPEDKIPPSFATWDDLIQRAQAYLEENRGNRKIAKSAPSTSGREPPYKPRLEDISQFVGRESELAAARRSLAETRLAAIIGEFGIGKTFLATRLATDLVSDSHKLFWHNFEYDQSFENFVAQLARFLAKNGNPALQKAWRQSKSAAPDYLMDVALQSLSGEGYLLCLDDFHMAAANPLVREFTGRLVADRIDRDFDLILTSRRILPLEWGAANHPLEGLQYPDLYALFQKRALPLLPADWMRTLYTLTQGHAYILSLAITLLQLNPDDPIDIIRHLERADDIRQYLLTEVFDQISDAQRAVMNAVAVLNKPATSDSIEIVANCEGVRQNIIRLSHLHLLKTSSGRAAARTYWMRNILRDFFYDLLDFPQKRAMHLRAAAHFKTDDPLKAAWHFQQGDERQKAAALLPEIANQDWELIHTGRSALLKTVLESFRQEDFTQPVRWALVQRGLGRIAMFRREVTHAQTHFRHGLDTLAALSPSDFTHYLNLQIYLDLSEMLEASRPQNALDYLRQGNEHLRALPEGGEAHRGEEIWLYNLMGRVQMELGDWEDAMRFFNGALEITREADAQFRIEALLNLGNICAWQGDNERSRQLYQAARQVCETSGDDFRRISVLIALGIDNCIAGDWDAARRDLDMAGESASLIGSVVQQVEWGLSMGVLYTRQGEFSPAERLLTETVAKAQTAELYAHEVDALSSLADFYIRQQNFEEAEHILKTALERARSADYHPAELFRSQAQIYLHSGNIPQARQSARQAMERSTGDDLEEGISLRVVGQVVAAEGQPRAAAEVFERSHALLEGRDPWETAQTLTEWGEALLPAFPQRARRRIQQAREIFQRLGAKHDLAIIEKRFPDL